MLGDSIDIAELFAAEFKYKGIAEIYFDKEQTEVKCRVCYNATVKTGIDTSLIQISDPDSDNIVEVYVPDAKVLNVYADKSSLTKPISETGLFTTISGEEKAAAFASAQSAMRQKTENDRQLLKMALMLINPDSVYLRSLLRDYYYRSRSNRHFRCDGC